jgi:hypothetical protein
MGVILHDQIILIAYYAKVRAASTGMPLGSVVIPVLILKLLTRYLKKLWGVHPGGRPKGELNPQSYAVLAVSAAMHLLRIAANSLASYSLGINIAQKTHKI